MCFAFITPSPCSALMLPFLSPTNSYLRRAKRIQNTMKRVSEENENNKEQ
jgi:hypothetical protein